MKLESFIRKENLHLILFGVQAFLALVFINFSFFSFLELIANFSSIVRTVLFVVFILLSVGLLFFLFIKPLIKCVKSIRNDAYFDAAKKVGENFPEVKDELINTMQLVSENKKGNLYSVKLIDAAFNKVFESVSI